MQLDIKERKHSIKIRKEEIKLSADSKIVYLDFR